MMCRLLGCFLALFAAGSLFAEVKLPAIFSDHAVLARRAKVPVWGTADPGEKVSVTLGEASASTTADAQGKWRVALDLSKSPAGPFELKVNDKTIRDVVVGEVWLRSGQSNMAFQLKDAFGCQEERKRPADPMFRCFTVRASSPTPMSDCKGRWVIAAPSTVGNFTAVGYFFGRKLRRELKAPVGLLHISWGGSPLQTWLSPEAGAAIPELVKSAKAQQRAFDSFDERRAVFCKALAAWCEKYDRADTPAPHALPPADAKWRTIKLGRLPGKPGAVWVRRNFKLTEAQAKKGIALWIARVLVPMELYVNGKFVANYPQEQIDGMRAFASQVKPEFLHAGENTVMLRLFCSYESPSIYRSVRIAGLGVGAEPWGFYREKEFSVPTAAMRGELPRHPGERPRDFFFHSRLYNGGIAPQVPAALSGVIWYQGESNAGNPALYAKIFPALIRDWRKQFENPDMPFYYCQLANYRAKKNDPNEVGWAAIREAQTATLSLPHTGQAVLIDLGEAGDIHPLDKKSVGDRLAALALARTYGKAVPCEGPRCKSVKVEGEAIRVTFDAVGGGLVAKPLPETYPIANARKTSAPLVRNSPASELEGFALCGADGKWFWADAKIDGDSVVVTSAKVPVPKRVRYAWGNNPTCNLYNKEGFPAVPFQSR